RRNRAQEKIATGDHGCLLSALLPLEISYLRLIQAFDLRETNVGITLNVIFDSLEIFICLERSWPFICAPSWTEVIHGPVHYFRFCLFDTPTPTCGVKHSMDRAPRSFSYITLEIVDD